MNNKKLGLAAAMCGAFLLAAIVYAAERAPTALSSVMYREVTVTDGGTNLLTVLPELDMSSGYDNYERVTLISVQNAGIRVRFDGVSPTNGTGHVIPAGSFMVWTRDMISHAQFTREAASNAVLAVSGAVEEK